MRTDNGPDIQPLERYGLVVMSIGFVMGDTDAVMLDTRFTGHIVGQTLQDVLWGELDYLLLDFPPGSGEPQRTWLNTIHMDGVLIVTTPQGGSARAGCGREYELLDLSTLRGIGGVVSSQRA